MPVTIILPSFFFSAIRDQIWWKGDSKMNQSNKCLVFQREQMKYEPNFPSYVQLLKLSFSRAVESE